MVPHPEFESISSRLASRVTELQTGFAGDVFRFVDPRYSSPTDLFAGKGSLFSNGRWMAKGDSQTTYTCLEPETALAESLSASRYYGFPISNSTPIVLVSAHVRLNRVINLCEGKTRQKLRLSENTILRSDWRKDNGSEQESITQAWGRALHSHKIEAVVVPSAALRNGMNVIVFPQNLSSRSVLSVVREIKWPKP